MSVHPLPPEVACDGPDAARDCPESAAISASFGSMTAAEVRADGRILGWTRRRRDGRLADLCPTCTKELR